MLKRIHHYNIIEELGRGGMGVVYKAEDTQLHRTVALKLLSSDSASDPKARERFMREARLASSFQHQNICTIHEIDETDDKQLFISMDYYEGATLQQILSEGTLSLDQILDYVIQIAEGLALAHEKGIIHRDIKPGNIIVAKNGSVKILDFGLAKLSGSFDSTQTGKALGTISYLSPEQAQGKMVDHRTDIWSLGVILYEMATGILPFTHEYDAAVIYSILDKSPLPPTEIQEDLPEELENIIYRCLRKNKDERIQSALELLKELKGIRENLHGKKGGEQFKSPPRKKQAERRLATVIVSEITGYHELLKKLDEEEGYRIMASCIEIFASTSRKYGGTFSGKGEESYMIVFGVPESGEKIPVRAVDTAMELRDRIQQLNKTENVEVPLDLKSGINSGMVIANSVMVGEMDEYSIAGDTLNFAIQLKDLSTGGQIMTGPMTFRNSNQVFDYKPLKSIIPEGKIDPVFIHLLLSKKAIPSKRKEGIEWMIQSKMVGREKELDTLQYSLMKLIHGEGFIVSVIGEAGLGKSRLVAEFLKKEEISRVRVLEGRAMSSGQNLSFHPLMDIIRSLANIKETDVESESLFKLEKTVHDYCPESADEVFPFIATLMGMNLSGSYAERIEGVEGEGLEKLILKNLRTLFSEATARQPLVFIIEDLHWADQSSIGFLKSLYRLAQSHAILFINVFRPDYKETGELIRAAVKDRYEKYHAEIILKSLDEHQSELLIRELLKTNTLPSKFNTLIKGKAEGNPFFIEELIHSMVEAGVITLDDGKVQFTSKIESLVIPESVHEVLIARIDKLDEDTRTLVKVASVIGTQFFYKVLLEVAGNEVDVDSNLKHLLEIQLIGESRRMGEQEYLFKHALIQQAAYNTILTSQRKELHLRVAQVIEKVFQNRLQDFYGILAYHYIHAEELDSAERYLVQAGERALRSSASSEALHYYSEALSIYLDKYGTSADPEKVANLHNYIGIAYFNTGHLIEAADYLEKVLSCHGMKIPANPLVKIFKLISGLIIFLFRIRFMSFIGRYTPTKQDTVLNELILKKASALVITDNKRFLINMILFAPWITRYRFENPETLIMIGGVFSMGGISLSMATRIIDYYLANSNQDEPKAKIAGSFARIVTNLLSGNWHNTPLDEQMVEEGLQIGETYNLVNYVAFKAHELLELGNRQAEQVLEKLSEMSELYENDFGRLASYTHGSLYLLKYREFEKALTMADEGIRFIRKTLGNKPGLLMIYSMKIRAQIMLGELNAAAETLQEAGEYTRQQKHSPYFLSFFMTASLLYETYKYEKIMNSGDKTRLTALRKRMLRTGNKALKVSKMMALERVETFRLMGVAFWLTGKEGKALQWWSRAIHEAEKLGAKLELSLTLQEVARRLSAPDSRIRELNGETAEALFQRTDQLFKEMNINII